MSKRIAVCFVAFVVCACLPADVGAGQGGRESVGTPEVGRGKAAVGMCPAPSGAKLEATPLTRDGYVALAKTLAASYGRRVGKALPQLDAALARSAKPTDGADLGAALGMTGAGSASIYATAWSAARQPDDLLTANNLGVALKDMGQRVEALQVLSYADRLRPNVALVIGNMAWVYYEAGDRASAKRFFERAATLAPKMASPQLGLGLVAECEGSHAVALQHLRKALPATYSAVGAKAYQVARAGAKAGNAQAPPVADERVPANGFSMPELPVYEQKSRMASAASSLGELGQRVDQRIEDLKAEYASLTRVVAQQQARASRQANAVVFARDFSKELFLFHDATVLLMGTTGPVGQALTQAATQGDQVLAMGMGELPAMQQDMEKLGALQKRYLELMNEKLACDGNELCEKQVDAKIKPVQKQLDELEFKMCTRTKRDLDEQFTRQFKGAKAVSDALKTTSADYYALTAPLLDRVFVPSLHDVLDVERELHVRLRQKAAIEMAAALPGIAANYASLTCVEPEPEGEAAPARDANVPKKTAPPCPFKKPLAFKVGVLGFELDCDHAKLEGGEGLLWSVERDFNKHETTYWMGVGADAGFGYGNLEASATIGVEMRVNGDVVQDVAVTSSVTTTVGGLIETEVSGRLAAEGGPSIEMDTSLTWPSLGDDEGGAAHPWPATGGRAPRGLCAPASRRETASAGSRSRARARRGGQSSPPYSRT